MNCQQLVHKHNFSKLYIRILMTEIIETLPNRDYCNRNSDLNTDNN